MSRIDSRTSRKVDTNECVEDSSCVRLKAEKSPLLNLIKGGKGEIVSRRNDHVSLRKEILLVSFRSF